MGFRDRCSSSVAPIFLRIALGITFIWAGSEKVFDEKPVRGDDAAILANLGVVAAPPKATIPAPSAAEPSATPVPGTPSSPPAKSPQSGGGGPPALMRLAPQVTPASGPYSAADFQSDVNVRGVHMLTLALIRNASPTDNKMPLWPPKLAQGKWPVYIAWTVAMTELVGGLWLLLGLFTRIAALGVSGVMLGAMWLTQFGPAMQAGMGHTYLGFIPRHPAFAVNDCGTHVYETLLWQLMLLAGGLAVLFTGSGALAIDRALFGTPAPSRPAAA